MARQSLPERVRGLFIPRRIVISLVLSVAVAMIIVGFLEAGGPEPPQARPAEILRVFPGEKDPIGLSQQPVGYQLADEFTGELRIDGRDIPLDQLERTDPVGGDQAPAARGLAGLNQVQFTPGQGKEFSRFQPGSHSAVAFYWKRLGETRDDARSYQWSFTAS